jgi:hypothetical protein
MLEKRRGFSNPCKMRVIEGEKGRGKARNIFKTRGIIVFSWRFQGNRCRI